MKIYLLLIAVCTLAANGKHIRKSFNSTNLENETEPQTKKHHKPTAIIKNIIQKPRIVVTFLTNTKTLIPYNNETEPEIMPRVDPFQRFLQFFFSNFIRDLTQPFAREERSTKILAKNETLCEKCEEHGELCCERCKRQVNATTTETKTTVTEGPKHKRHYFLSISGGTDKRATAMKPTVRRHKRQQTAAPPVASATNATTEDDLEPATEDVVSSKDQSYSDSNYLFTVTLPAFIVFCVLMVGLCFCLRSNGFCCRLFLSDPTKVTIVVKPPKQ